MTPELQPSTRQGPPGSAKAWLGFGVLGVVLTFAATSITAFVFGYDGEPSEALAALYMALIAAYITGALGKTYVSPKVARWTVLLGNLIILIASALWLVPVLFGVAPEILFGVGTAGLFGAAIGLVSALIKGGA